MSTPIFDSLGGIDPEGSDEVDFRPMDDGGFGPTPDETNGFWQEDADD